MALSGQNGTRVHEAVIVGIARTPLGRFGGSLATLPAAVLGGHAISAVLEHARCPAAMIDYVVMGHVLQAGGGQITSRQAAAEAGVGMEAPAETINKVCLSGMTAIARARDLVRLGSADVVVAGGMESMSQAPYLLDRTRLGYRLGSAELIDSLMHDGLTCAFDGCSMGLATDRNVRGLDRPITRAEQDEFAARSHERAARAHVSGAFADELVPIEGPAGRVDVDEGVRAGATPQALAALSPAFDADGTITAGNASQISDGAAAVIVARRDVAEQHGLDVVATIESWAAVAGPDPSLPLQPANAVRSVARQLDRSPASFDLYEINEAFASVAIASMRDLEVNEERVNVNGGAIALGHPLGCSGARIVVALVNALRARGGGSGVAALCGGGGQGDALALRVD